MIIDTEALRARIEKYAEDAKNNAWGRIATPMEKSVGEVTRIAEHWHNEKAKLLGDVEKVEKIVGKILEETGGKT
jgi:molecular chaperone GrpE (heat shock protein)